MALTDSEEDLNWVRSKVGDTPDDTTLDEIYDRDGMGTRESVARWVLENRLANLMAAPESFTIPGQYSQSTGKNIDALTKMIDSLPAVEGDEFEDNVVTFVSPCPQPR